MVNVWRLETVKGKGIYESGVGSQAVAESGYSFGRESSNRPMPYNDLKLKQSIKNHSNFREVWVFGFASRRAYKSWFDSVKIRRTLARYTKTRIILSLYHVPRSAVCRGNCQLRFNRAKAELIACYWPDSV